MKTLKQPGVLLCSLFLILFICFEFFFFPVPFSTGKLESNYEINNIGNDTTLRFQKYDDFLGYKVKSGAIGMAGFPFTIKAIGNINSDSEIYLKFVGYPGKVYTYFLPKGKIDTTFRGELYEDEAEIVYLHKKAKSGNLKLTFRLGHDVKKNIVNIAYPTITPVKSSAMFLLLTFLSIKLTRIYNRCFRI